MTAAYTPAEMMTVTAARALGNDDICFVGIGLPSAACNLARLTHAPRLTLVYESGTLETKPTVLPLSIGDGELCETALVTVSVPEMFQYWLQGGRITVGFLGGAQVAEAIHLRAAEKADRDAPALEPVLKHLRNRHSDERRFAQLAVADRQRQHRRLRLERPGFVNERETGRVRQPCEVAGGGRKPDADEADIVVAERARGGDSHHLGGCVRGRHGCCPIT